SATAATNTASDVESAESPDPPRRAEPDARHPKSETANPAAASGQYAHGYTAPKARAPHATAPTRRAVATPIGPPVDTVPYELTRSRASRNFCLVSAREILPA